MEILKNLWQVGGAEFTSVEDAAIYLIRFGKKAALIDAGCGGAHGTLAANISEVLPPDTKIEYLFNADILCEGHFGIYQGKNEVSQFIRTYLQD
jgi:hypothetical protein